MEGKNGWRIDGAFDKFSRVCDQQANWSKLWILNMDRSYDCHLGSPGDELCIPPAGFSVLCLSSQRRAEQRGRGELRDGDAASTRTFQLISENRFHLSVHIV
jgi:hypothetical protein